MMTFRIEQIQDRLVIGMKTKTSVLNINTDTRKVAHSFMPRRNEVEARKGKHVFSIQNYGLDYNPSDVDSQFDKWVAVEVTRAENIPDDMKKFIIEAGTYAVFDFKGAVADFPKSRQYIFSEWLPKSGYQLDRKAHFEILNEDYSKDLQNIEEEIWIPVCKI